MPDNDIYRDTPSEGKQEREEGSLFVSSRYASKLSPRGKALKRKGIRSTVAGVVLVLLILIGFGGFIGLYVWQNGQAMAEMLEETEKLAEVFFETQRLERVRKDAWEDIRDNSRIDDIENHFGISRTEHDHRLEITAKPVEEVLNLLNLIINDSAVAVRRLSLHSSLSFPVFPRTAFLPVIKLQATVDISIAKVF